MLRPLFQALDQRIDAGIIGRALPPIELFERGEAMLLDRQHLFRRERPRPFLDQRAKGAVALMPPGAAGDLRHFGDAQATLAMAVEFVEAGKGDMRHIHVEPHADRVGRDQIIDLARLEHRHLRVARARGQSAHHHRRAAAQPPQHLRHRIDFFGAERDDRRAFGQAADLLGPGIGQRRKARAIDDLDLGHQRLEHRPQRFGAEQHRLLPTPCA
ncbi:hypothetical protein D9M73_127680 [compost metagenome]